MTFMTGDSHCRCFDSFSDFRVIWRYSLVSLYCKKHSFLLGGFLVFSRYPSDCKSVYATFISNPTFVIPYDKGIAKIDMATEEQTVLLSNCTPSCKKVRGIAPFKDQGETVFTDVGSRQIKKVSSNGIAQIIAGSREEGNKDGTRGSFYQSMGICMETGRIFLPLTHRLEQ